MVSAQVRDLIIQLHEIGAVKFGQFTLKSGIQSPVYIDLRVTVSYPAVLDAVGAAMWELVKQQPRIDLLCGVPYTALPIATAMSLRQNKPMVVRRKEEKKYGTKKIIEGVFEKGQQVLIVEDLVTSGMSVFETIAPLEAEGLVCKDIVVLLDRQQGAREHITGQGYSLFSVFTMTELAETLMDAGRLERDTGKLIFDFIASAQTSNPKAAKAPAAELSFGARAELVKNPCGKALLNVMEAKQSNLCVAADLISGQKLLELADAIGPEICLLKTHVDIIEDFSEDLVKQLSALADKHGFLIFEDRKFADIGSTAMHQYRDGVYHIAEWSHMVNAHLVPGPGVVTALREVGLAKERGCVLIAEMSSKGTLAKGDYTKATAAAAEEHKDFCFGFICQNRIAGPEFVHMTPGVKFDRTGDAHGQQYNTPASVVANGTDVIIVGRGIYEAKNPAAAAKEYRAAAWAAYEARVGK